MKIHQQKTVYFLVVVSYIFSEIISIKSKVMFGIFKKNPIKELEKKYNKLLEEAMQLQRSGDIKGYAEKTEEAEKIAKEIEKINS